MNDWQKNLKNWPAAAKAMADWQTQPFIKQLAKKFPQADIFLVGGAVRDAILNRPTKDFDFVVRGVAKNDLQNFLAALGKVSLVGKKFGVFKFRPKGWTGEDIDIALPRTEHSIGLTGAYRDFKIQSNAKLKIEDDLSRRDFTVNAMAFQIVPTSYKLQATSYLIDPFNGLSDLKKGLIKAVGKPEIRFQEDYSRILRVIRLAGQLHFEIEAKTWKALVRNIKKLNQELGGKRTVPYEVIAKELFKAISQNPIFTLELLDQSGAIKTLMPDLLKMKGCPQPKNFHTEGDCWQHTILAIKNLESKNFQKEFKNQKPSAEVIWGLLFHDIGKPETLVKADRLRFNNHDNVSAKKFRQIAEQLKLASAGLDIDKTQSIIAKHMLFVHNQVISMKETTVEKYFFNPNFPGLDLMMLIYADISATISPGGKPNWSDYLFMKKRIAKLAKKSKNKIQLAKSLVNGTDLIKEFKLKSSPQIGQLLALVREAQLQGKIKDKKQGLLLVKKAIKK
ncbi:MAG: HDIG domain-containing metalloprotein [Patescibacteria group bacterium]